MRFSADRPLGLAPATALDHRELARRRLPRQLFDYIDGGAYEETTMRANDADLAAVRLRQRVLRDVSRRGQSVTVLGQELSRNNRFHMSQYLIRRARDWKAAGFSETLDTFPELNDRSKFFSANARAAFMNWASVRDLRNPLGGRQGISEQVQMRELLRRVIAKVMAENDLDVMVNLLETSRVDSDELRELRELIQKKTEQK